MIGDILYKRTSTGAVQIWRQQLSDDGGAYRTISGQIEGKQVMSEWTTCVGKNLGRANATSPQVQALREVEANYKYQLKQGCYWERVEDIDKETYFEPMLAKEFYKVEIKNGVEKITDNRPTEEQYAAGIIYAQPKLDGIRNLGRKAGFFSREGGQFITCDHIRDELRPLFETDSGFIFDGELYNHDLKDDFNEISSLVKKTKPTADDLVECHRVMQYHIYDFPSAGGKFSDRIDRLVDLLDSKKMLDHPLIRLVPTYLVANADVLNSLYEQDLANGYEGQMVRLDVPYENKRSKALLKRKEFQEDEFEIAGFIEGKGNRAGMVGAVVLYLPDRRTFKADPLGKADHKRDLLRRQDELVGKPATIKFFHYTPDGKPRFGKVKAIHETPKV